MDATYRGYEFDDNKGWNEQLRSLMDSDEDEARELLEQHAAVKLIHSLAWRQCIVVFEGDGITATYPPYRHSAGDPNWRKRTLDEKRVKATQIGTSLRDVCLQHELSQLREDAKPPERVGPL